MKQLQSNINDRLDAAGKAGMQLTIPLSELRTEVEDQARNVCPSCGHPGLVPACHIRCPRCGYMPSCDD